jgi:LPXTG-motif cell wall-anchored protein
MRRRRSVLLAATIPAALAAALLATPAAFAADTDIVINEVQSTSATAAPDFIELTNTGTAPVDVSNWLVKDDNDARTLRIPAGTVIAPGDFAVVEPDVAGGFGLGSTDRARVYAADGTTLVDEYSWTDHAASEGRLPDGTGSFVDTEPTPGQPNIVRSVDYPVVINEVESNGDSRGDWVELANTDTVNTFDLSGWTLVDADPTHDPIVFPAGTTIESGGHLGVVTDGTGYTTSFGLGGGDSVTLRAPSGQVVDEYAWTTHAATTYGRCPDMTGAFALTASGSFALANACTTVDEPEPGVETDPWPYGDDVVPAVAPGTWGDDMSGLDHAADGTLFAVNNDNAEIFEMRKTAPTQYEIADSWVPTYPDGSGTPDAEGITVAGDGAMFLSTERDNQVKGVSRPSVLRVELGADGTTTTHEWNLTAAGALPALGANAGIEAIEWISDADATRLGVRDESTGTAYEPGGFGEHFGGIFAIAVEETGSLHLVVLESSGDVTVLQDAEPGPAVEVAMALDWRAGGNALWAMCDDLCNSAASELAFVDGVLTAQRDVAAPTTMPDGYTNEGLAIDWCETEPSATPAVAWISDAAHEGVSLRVAAGDTCAAAVDTPLPGDGSDDAGDVGGGDVAGGASSGGILPDTGAEVSFAMLMVAALLLAAGAGLVLRARRALPSAWEQ